MTRGKRKPSSVPEMRGGWAQRRDIRKREGRGGEGGERLPAARRLGGAAVDKTQDTDGVGGWRPSDRGEGANETQAREKGVKDAL